MNDTETGVLLIDSYDELWIVAANFIIGLLFLGLYPWLLPTLAEQSASGRGNAVVFGFYLGLLFVPVVFFALSYAGYKER